MKLGTMSDFSGDIWGIVAIGVVGYILYNRVSNDVKSVLPDITPQNLIWNSSPVMQIGSWLMKYAQPATPLPGGGGGR